MVYMYIQTSVQSDKSAHSVQSYTEGYTIILETKVVAEIQKKEICRIYNQDKDCKFWAGLLLRNVVYLLSFIAPAIDLRLHKVVVRQTP